MKQVNILSPFVLVLLLCGLTTEIFGQFEARMHYILSGIEKDFKVYSDVNRYRYEFNEDGQEGIVIVLNKTNEVFVLMPQQMMVFKTNSSSQMSMANDPVKQYEYQQGQGAKEKVIGKEEVNGYSCIKKELYNESEQLLYTLWFSEEYHFPIKIISHIDVTGTTSMELKNIQSWIPDDAKFSIPEGYMVMDQQTMMPEH